MHCQSIRNINPQLLRAKTSTMLNKVVQGTDKSSVEAVKEYFHFVNENNLHGPALVAYQTELGKLTDYRRYFPHKIAKKIPYINELISNISKKSPEVKTEVDTFVAKLNKDYPKTLGDRISLSSQGAVSYNKVEPKSRFKKFMVLFNRFMQVEE